MGEPTNVETYDFISRGLTYHPELPQFSAKELAAPQGRKQYWINI